MLSLSPSQLHQLHCHAYDCYPEECCGLLLGHNGQVTEVRFMQNSWQSDFSKNSTNKLIETRRDASRRNRFAIAPLEMLEAQKDARTKQLDIIGIYHSHPDHPAVPSEYDRAIAWAEYSYLIMAVTAKDVMGTRSWKLDGDRQFIEEQILIEETNEP